MAGLGGGLGGERGVLRVEKEFFMSFRGRGESRGLERGGGRVLGLRFSLSLSQEREVSARARGEEKESGFLSSSSLFS